LAFAERVTHPVFLVRTVPKDATPWVILSWGSTLLHGPSRNLRARPLGSAHLSWGFVPLQRSRWREPTSRLVAQVEPPGCPGSADESHPAGYGAAHRFSQPLSGFLRSPPSCHFQAGGALGVRPSGVSSPHAAPETRRHRRTLLTFIPADWPGSRPRREHPWARPTVFLGVPFGRHSSSSGSCSAWESIRIASQG